MHTPLRLRRSLLAFAAALTLGCAQSPWHYETCDQHNGWLQLGSTSGDGSVVRVVGWVTTATIGNLFGIETSPDANRATFHWGGDCYVYQTQLEDTGILQFGLYCTNCDGQTIDPQASKDVFNSAHYDAAEIIAFGYAADGTPDQWVLVNGGPQPSTLARRESHVAQSREDSMTVQSVWFTIDSNDYVYPTVLDLDSEILEPMLNAWYLAPGHAITFSEGTGPNGEYNVLLWVDMPSN